MLNTSTASTPQSADSHTEVLPREEHLHRGGNPAAAVAVASSKEQWQQVVPMPCSCRPPTQRVHRRQNAAPQPGGASTPTAQPLASPSCFAATAAAHLFELDDVRVHQLPVVDDLALHVLSHLRQQQRGRAGQGTVGRGTAQCGRWRVSRRGQQLQQCFLLRCDVCAAAAGRFVWWLTVRNRLPAAEGAEPPLMVAATKKSAPCRRAQ